MPRYHTDNRLAGAQQNLAAAYKTLLSIAAVTATLKRGRLMELIVGADGAPNATDCQIVFSVDRQTAAPTASAITPTPNDPADTASGSVALANATVEGTITALSTLLNMSLNQRASQRWVAFDESSGLVWPATNLNGLAIRALSPTYAAAALASAQHLE